MSLEKTLIGNLKEFISKKEFLNVFLVNGIKLSGFVAFASKDLVILCNNRKGKTFINPSTIATFQVAKEFANFDDGLLAD